VFCRALISISSFVFFVVFVVQKKIPRQRTVIFNHKEHKDHEGEIDPHDCRTYMR
jgi:hypothetical protein